MATQVQDAALPGSPVSASNSALDAEGARIVKKVGRRTMWYLIVLYIVSVLDRSNLGFASFSMNKELGLTPQMYGIGVGVLYLGYALFELPSNLALARFGARITLTRIALMFGLVTMSMAFVVGPNSFYLVRALLGIAEAGLSPGIFLYLSYWIPQHYRARYNGIFTYSIPCAYIASSIVSGAIMQLDGTFGVPGWKWLFILEGLPAVLLGVFGMFYLTDRPHMAKWLSTSEQQWLQQQIDNDVKTSSSNHDAGMRALLKKPVLWLLAFGYIGVFCGNATLGVWLPQILHSHGVPLRTIGLMAAIPPVAGLIGMILLCRRSDRRNERVYHTVFAMLLASAGCGMVAISNGITLALAGFMIANVGIYASLAIFWAIPQTFLSPKVKPAAIAVIGSCGALFGGWLTPTLVGRVQTVTHSLSTGLVIVAVTILICAISVLIAGLKLTVRK